MQQHWTDHDLETYWSCSSDELKLLPPHEASSRLGVAASLKFFQLEGSFYEGLFVKRFLALFIIHWYIPINSHC